MKTNDIHICAFPKSGITYLGFMLVAARLHHSGMKLVPTMYNIDFLMIDTHKMGSIEPADIWSDGIGNLYKTHAPFFKVPNAIYLLREPVAALRSYFHFRRQLGARESVRDFLQGPDGIAAWVGHVRSWLLENLDASRSVFVTDYERLMSDPAAELRALGGQLGLPFSDETVNAALEASSLARMRQAEACFAARNPVYARFGLQFVRPGESRSVEEITPELIGLIRTHAQPIYEEARSHLRELIVAASAASFPERVA
jgi:hypothetical protein